MTTYRRLAAWLCLWLTASAGWAAAAEDARLSHTPMRPLPEPSARPLADGPASFVDPVGGDDAQDGTQAAPWKSVAHAAGRLRAGDTLYLRGGTYYEHVTVAVSGEAGQPITIRGYPGELAVLDGGLREFFEKPATAWEPCPDGVIGEFQSTRTYPDLGGTADHTNVLGHFGDSMVPLHGYRYRADLQDTSMYWDIKNKVGGEDAVYCGPGVFYDLASGRFHARLAHTTLSGLGADNYRGATDPRKLPLVVAGGSKAAVLQLRGVQHVSIQDLVVRGGLTAAVEVTRSEDVTFEGLTVYGGYTCFNVTDTARLRLYNTACRGIAAPWTFRGSLKYRAVESRIFSAGGWEPTGADNHDFELAYSEFTDSVDGVFIGNVARVSFHHNLLDNITDDGIFLTATTAMDGVTPGGDVQIYQNLLSRCLTTFAFGVGHGRQKWTPAGKQTGSGVYIYRNVCDYRRPVNYYQPSGPESPQSITSKGRFASDHGSPAWEPLTIYHNTIIADDQVPTGYGAIGLCDHVEGAGARRVFNNIVVQVDGQPGRMLPTIRLPAVPAAEAREQSKRPGEDLDALLDSENKKELDETDAFSAAVDPEALRDLAKTANKRLPVRPTDVQVDGNLLWSLAGIPTPSQEYLAKFRRSPAFDESKSLYAPGWTANDRVADPRFVLFDREWSSSLDLTLQPGSSCINGGLALPALWPDPLREIDDGRPDQGAIPAGIEPWHVGVAGRLTMFGVEKLPRQLPHLDTAEFPPSEAKPQQKSAAVVSGYPAFDAPLIRFALRRKGIQLDDFDQSWLNTDRYGTYGLVAIVGDLIRGRTVLHKFDSDDLKRVERFLSGGGTLLISLQGKEVFSTPEGREFLARLAGDCPEARRFDFQVRLPDHPWVDHLNARSPAWMPRASDPAEYPLRTSRGECIIGTAAGHAILYRLPVGDGELVYIGWQIHDSRPPAQGTDVLDQERAWEEQAQIVLKVFEGR